MKIYKFFSIVTLITTIALSYVQQQVEVVKISYNIRNREEKLSRLLDQHDILMYNVLTLESPESLEKRLITKYMKLEIPGRWQIVRLIESGQLNENETKPSTIEKRRPVFFSFFTLKSKAEAIPQIEQKIK